MRIAMTYRLLLLLVVIAAWTARGAAAVSIITATYFGAAAGDSDLQGASAAADGTIYIVGNSAVPTQALPGRIVPTTFATAMPNPKCGCGFVAHLSADGTRILHYAQFAPGVALLSTVQIKGGAVYLGGYASVGLQEAIRNVPGLTRTFPLVDEIQLYERERAAGKEDKIAGRRGLGRYGAPCVIRLSADLKSLQAGTYLEGWQQVWDKKRVAKPGKEMLGGYQEYFWQPTGLALLKDDDLVVCHDGGYFRMPTDRDKEIARGDQKLADRLTFYDTCDYVSRLSPDLAARKWKKAIYTPMVDPEVAKRVKEGWPLDHYSSPRTQRMRLNQEDQIYLCGWSASATSKEPYWSPYLFRLDPATGNISWKVYEYDPMSGGGNRMNGQVADTAITSLALDGDGNILASLLSDGGNTVMEWSPKARRLGERFETKTKGGGFPVKLVHWWGQIHRVDAKTGEGLGGARIGAWGWAHDIAALPDGGVIAFGRYNWKFQFTGDAWAAESSIENPNAFVRVYSPKFDLLFSSALPGVVPFAIDRAGADRYLLVGRAEQGVALTKNALFSKSAGKTDGYLMILSAKRGKQ